jgi:hypothetical protein
MLTLRTQAPRLCDGSSRRDFLRVGALAGLGLSMPGLLSATESRVVHKPSGSFGKAKRCVLLFLMGGPPQHDTWDLKPQAPAEIRGELKPIPTNVSGIEISELFPKLARHADKYTLVRSVTHGDNTHTTAAYTMLTGTYHPTPGSLNGPRPDDHPHIGSIVAQERGFRELPPFISLPETIKDAGVNEVPGQRAGFLPGLHDPFGVQANEDRTALRPPSIVPPVEITAERLGNRRALLDRLNRSFRAADAARETRSLDGHYDRAFQIIDSAKARQAFELERESDKVREAYGKHLFGQGCLLARRLLEAGVSLVTVYWHYEGPEDSPVWDTHWNNFKHLRERLMPPTDQAVSALLGELSERGMLEDTLVITMGEFGRTPKINGKAGRDHWPHVQSILLAGGGIPGGRVFGASDDHGAQPAKDPVTPPELSATFLHLLGISPDTVLHDQLERPHPASRGEPVRGLMI